MKIFDMHIHAYNTAINQADFLQKLELAGVYGGCVFSNWPKRAHPHLGTSFEERLAEVQAWCKGCEDRLFPVLWIHPYEDNVLDYIHQAVDAGIAGFKIICTDFYVHEDKCLNVLQEIAKLDKPVFFHSGILWDAQVSSNYNRPLHWEALLDIVGLRFSMGHCSWPWIDECIALYGKFLDALQFKNTSEMFLDLTPGTPKIYRKELLTKLYTIGYDVDNNLLYGTDGDADAYRSSWTKECLTLDNQIMDELQISEESRQKLFHDNIIRFLGKTKSPISHKAPSGDSNNGYYFTLK